MEDVWLTDGRIVAGTLVTHCAVCRIDCRGTVLPEYNATGVSTLQIVPIAVDACKHVGLIDLSRYIQSAGFNSF